MSVTRIMASFAIVSSFLQLHLAFNKSKTGKFSRRESIITRALFHRLIPFKTSVIVQLYFWFLVVEIVHLLPPGLRFYGKKNIETNPRQIFNKMC